MAKAQKRSRGVLPHLLILEDISALISHSQDLQETLKSIVAIVVERMETEVCSLYILDRQKNRLTLRATMGLDQESVGKVSMGINEGLTGLVIEKSTISVWRTPYGNSDPTKAGAVREYRKKNCTNGEGD